MKTLRATLAARIQDLFLFESEGQASAALSEVIEFAIAATRDWLAQPEIMVVISNGLSETGTVGGAALALRREAVK